MKSRPALAAALIISGGICFARFIPMEWTITLSCALFFLTASIVELIMTRGQRGRRLSHSYSLVPLLFFSSTAAYSINDQLHDNRHITHYLNNSDSLTIYGKVIDAPNVKDGRTMLLLSIQSLSNEFDTMTVEGKAYVTIFSDKRLKEIPKGIPYGSFVSFRSILQTPSSERNPGEFSYRDYLALNNIYATISVFGYSNVTISPNREPNIFFEYIIFPSKEFVIKTIRTVMKGDEANFLIGLLLGDRTEISDEIKSAFMNTGTIHVLAVSGSHVVLVAEIIFVIVGLLRFSRKPKILLAMFFLIYYMFLTGATPSVVRATLMIIVLYVGKLFEERTDVYNVLGVSAVIILLIEPKQLFDVGFQLSFSAVFSIVYFYPKLNALIPKIPEPLEELKIMKWLWQLFAVSLAAQIGTLPFTAFYFGKVSIVSLFANLVVVPLVGVVVTIGLSGAILGIGWMWIASCFSDVNNIIAIVTLNFVKWAEQVPFAIVNTATFGFKETVTYSLLIGFLFNIGNRSMQKKMMFASLFFANGLLFMSFMESPERKLRITFLDVGQGDGAVIQFPNGESLIVDAGPRSPGSDAGEKTIAPFLRRRGISIIDAILTTHPHADHLGGVPYLMKHFTVRQTIDANQAAASSLFTEYQGLETDVKQITARAGMILSIGGAQLYILHPTERFIDPDSSDGYADLNETSVVFKFQYGETSLMFTGDAELESEGHIIHSYTDFLKSDLLKAGHHGSSTSSSEEFVAFVKPKDVVVSVAKFNKFRHPSKRVVERFIASGATVYRTDKEGAVVFESDGKSLMRIGWRE